MAFDVKPTMTSSIFSCTFDGIKRKKQSLDDNRTLIEICIITSSTKIERFGAMHISIPGYFYHI